MKTIHRDAQGRFAKQPKLPNLPPFPEDLVLKGTGKATLEWLFVAKKDQGLNDHYRRLACIKDGVVGYISGALLRHPDARDPKNPCTVFLNFLPEDGARSYAFVLRELDPPTVSPSIICHSCGAHSFLQQGVWPGSGYWVVHRIQDGKITWGRY